MSFARKGLLGTIFLFFLALSIILFSAPINSSANDHVVVNVSTPSVSNFSGAATYGIPIEVPPGRQGIEPKLSLAYNSYMKNGWIGVGWGLDLGSIKRNTKRGVDYSTNDYVASINGSQSELVARGDWGVDYYGAKIEGAFLRYFYDSSSGGWEVTAKNGIKYYYGTTSASRQDSSNGVFAWQLDRVEDTNGNYMTVTYIKDQGAIYPERIDYTGNSGLSPTNYVQFYLEDRTDTPTMFKSHSLVKTAKRLKTISVGVSGAWVRAYALSYTASTGISRSLLSSVQQYGSDVAMDGAGVVTGGTSLPSTTVEWRAGNDGDFSIWSWEDLNVIDDTYESFFADVNGDRKVDWIVRGRVGSGHTGIHVALSNGDGSFGSGSGGNFTWSWEHLYTADDKYNSHFADVNGDGMADWIIRAKLGTGINDIYVALANGDGSFGAGTSELGGWQWTWQHTATANDKYESFFADINGDGMADWIVRGMPGQGYKGVHVALANGDGSLGDGTLPNGFFKWSWQHLYTANDKYNSYFADVNGDGMADWIVRGVPGQGYKGVHVALANGDGSLGASVSSANGGFRWSWQHLYTANDKYNSYFADINGDGMADWIVRPVPDSGLTGIHVALSNGDGSLGEGTLENGGFLWSWQELNASSDDYASYFADVDGNGMADWIVRGVPDSGLTDVHVALSNGNTGNFVSSIENPFGGTASFTYEPSSSYSNGYLPFIVQTSSSVTTDDGLGTISTTSYNYSGGLYSSAEREFRGFQTVTATDPMGTVTETLFSQDDIYAGRPYQTQTRDSSGNIYSLSQMTYLSTSPYTGVNFPYAEWKNDYVYDGTSTYINARTSFTYDAYGNVTRKYFYGDVAVSGDERDEYTTYNYDTTNWIVAQPAHTYVYDSSSALKAQNWYAYDSVGNLTIETAWLDGGANPAVTYTYDGNGNVLTVTDPNGNTTATTYDSSETYPVSVTNAIGHTGTTSYDYKFGKPVLKIDANGNTSTYEYDVLGRVVKETNPNDGASTYGTVSYSYLNFGTPGSQKVVTYVTEQSGTANHIWSEAYFDGFGRKFKTRSEGPDSKVIVKETVYDERGLVASASLPYFDGIETPRWTTVEYDPIGRQTLATNPDSTSVTVSYLKGTLTTINANGQKKVEEKDIYGRLVKVEEYTGTSGSHALYATTNYSYNVTGNLIGMTDTLGNQTTIAYDTFGRKTSIDDPDMGLWSYAYDANGNLISQTDAKGQTITFTYDALNRMTLKDYPTGTDAVYSYDETFSTNSKGRLTTVSDASGTTKYYYDKLGQNTKKTRTIDSVNYMTESTYDALGRTTSLKYPDAETVSYTYDSGGNLSLVSGYVFYSSYNAIGQAETVTYANGVNTANEYRSDNNRLLSITTSNTGGDLLDLSYAYDSVGNVSTITDNLDATRSQSFTYDSLNRITQAVSTSYGGSGMLTYSYDQIGNILSKEGVSYTYAGTRAHAVTSTSNGKSYTYDANGNMTADTIRTINYDYDNMPSSITVGAVTSDFVYDAAGARVKKTTTGVTTIYIGKVYECVNGNCSKYVFAGETRVALKNAANTYYYHQDHLGSSSVITDASGVKVEEIYYYPFGGTRIDTGSIDVNHKYTSQELDSETGFYYYNARYYDPVLGRFISPDPIVPDPTNPQALNRYSYVLNNPLNNIDPTGHFSLKKFLKKVVAGIAGAATFVLTGGNIAAAGAVYGAVDAALNGGDVFQGAVMGALMGAIAAINPAIAGTMFGGGAVMAYKQEGLDGLAYMAGSIIGGSIGALGARVGACIGGSSMCTARTATDGPLKGTHEARNKRINMDSSNAVRDALAISKEILYRAEDGGLWRKDTGIFSKIFGVLHGKGSTTWKCVAVCRGSEISFSANGSVILNGPYRGSFNYVTPYNRDGSFSLSGTVGHHFADATLHAVYGF